MQGFKGVMMTRKEMLKELGFTNDMILEQPIISDEEVMFILLVRKLVELADKDQLLIRAKLWQEHDCPLNAKYADDGEMQCLACGIDFKRHPVDTILYKLIKNEKRFKCF